MNLRTRTMPTGEQPSSSPPPAPAELEAKFPQFEILECLGRGGMGVVYKARQKALDRIVAIKILAGEFQDDPGFASRFEKEAKLLARLNHPNIVTIHDFGHGGGLFHIVMEYIDGVNVRDLLRDGRLEPEQALAIVPPICDALQFAHDHGVVHRDIKPENILLDREGRVKIADFGIATIAGEAADRSGTPDYMAPEISGHGSGVDHRADIYSLGVVLYEMLTGRRPDKQIEVPSSRVQLDVKIDEIVLRALQGKPELRYQTAGEFKTVVATIASSPTPPTPASSPPPQAPPTPAPVREPVPLAARVPETAVARQFDQRLALIFLLVAFFGTPLLMSLVRPSKEGVIFFLGLGCAVASVVFAIRARRSRTGKAVLAVWTTLIVASALMLFVYFVPANKAANAQAESERRQSQIQAELARDQERELDVRIDAARIAAGVTARLEGHTEASIRVDLGMASELQINGIAFSHKEFPLVLRKIAKDRGDLPVRIVGATLRFEPVAFSNLLFECRREGFGKITFWHAPDSAGESALPPIFVGIGRDRSISIDGRREMGNFHRPLGEFAAADPLRQVRITALDLEEETGDLKLDGLMSMAFQVIYGCREVGCRRISFTTEAAVARTWQDEAQRSAATGSAPPAPASPGKTVRVAIDGEGGVHLDGRAVAPNDLLGEFRKLKEGNFTPYIEIEADPVLPYAKVLPVLNLCHQAGLIHVSILEATREAEPPLPAAGAGVAPEPVLPELEPIDIHIAADGLLKLEETPVTLEELQQGLIDIVRRGGVARPVTIRGRPGVPAARVGEVTEACERAGLEDVLSEKRSADRLREIDLSIALKSYEALLTKLRDARLDRELLTASGKGGEDEELIKAERLIATLQQQVDEERVVIQKLQSESPNAK